MIILIAFEYQKIDRIVDRYPNTAIKISKKITND